MLWSFRPGSKIDLESKIGQLGQLAHLHHHLCLFLRLGILSVLLIDEFLVGPLRQRLLFLLLLDKSSWSLNDGISLDLLAHFFLQSFLPRFELEVLPDELLLGLLLHITMLLEILAKEAVAR